MNSFSKCTSKERVWLALSHQQPDRVPVMDSVWKATEEKWHQQGLPEGVSAAEFFEFDMAWFFPDVSLQLPYKILKEDEEYITYSDSNGCIRRDHKDFTTTPQVIKTIIQKPDDWKKVKERLCPNLRRINLKEEIQRFKRAQEANRYTVYCVATGYDWTQHIIDSEQLLYYIIAEPELVIDVYRTHARLCLQMYDMMRANGFLFNGALIFSDMGYRQGLLFSPRHYLEQFHPVLKEMCEYFHSNGMQVILHSCGNVKDLIPYFIEAGVDCLNPLEVKAGMDVLELKREFGNKLAFFGGIDIRVLESGSLELIEQTLTSIIPVANEGGGYIFGSDHSISIGVSFESFRYACELVRKLTHHG